MKILIADDEVALREELGDYVMRHGHEALLAVDGEDAFQKAEAHEDELDLILTDIRMPKMDGCALLQKLHDRQFDIPTVVMTGHGDLDLSIEVLRLGAFDFLAKPFRPKVLKRIIDKLEKLQVSHKNLAQSWKNAATQVYIEAPSQVDAIDGIVHQVTSYLQPFATLYQFERNKLQICIHEALVNAIIHGNLGVPSSLKESSLEEFHEMVNERQKDPQYSSKMVLVEVEMREGQLSIQITDEGKGFDPTSLPDPNDIEALLSSGRGIVIIRSFMDEVLWNEKGNQIKMIKKCEP